MFKFLNCFYNKNIPKNTIRVKCVICKNKVYNNTSYCDVHWRDISKYCLYRI